MRIMLGFRSCCCRIQSCIGLYFYLVFIFLFYFKWGVQFVNHLITELNNLWYRKIINRFEKNSASASYKSVSDIKSRVSINQIIPKEKLRLAEIFGVTKSIYRKELDKITKKNQEVLKVKINYYFNFNK